MLPDDYEQNVFINCPFDVQFQRDLPTICEELHFDHKDLNFTDLSFTIAAWLREHS